MNKVPASAFKHPVHFLAIGLGSGAAPKAPGTWGTVAAAILYIPLSDLNLTAYLAVIVVAALVGVYLCGKTSADWGVHDHGAIVWDEFVGFWITMIAVPFTWYWLLAGFALFRLFDIWKPWPIQYFDKHVHGGLGIMVDDIIAGLFALVILQLLVVLF
ncbi:MAG: phosphatidylglycerophosphatase A [Gammaproteobacteria bacterium]|nr:MAG: phosphatidylglycerophosphatase A [Gammaproteobacteria bacterium]